MNAIKYFACISSILFSPLIYSQIPDTVWTKTFGGPLADAGNSVKQTIDGGFIVAATTSSFGAGGQDVYLIKTDENGDTLWTKTFGGAGNDRASNVVQTNDHGYAIFGTTNSFGNGGDDFLFWKTDSLGNTEWFKTYGTGIGEVASEGQQTSDGGFVIVGYYYNQVYRTWTVKSDSLGNEIWNKSIRWSSSDLFGYSVQQTDDKGFVICGTWRYWYSGSYRYNFTLTKLSEDGDSLFVKYYERNGSERGRIIRKTLDENFILGGITFSSGGSHTWLVKVSQSGGMVWQKVVIGSQNQINFQCVEPTMDGGYIIAISSVGGSSSVRDFQILKTDNLGTFLWEKMIGGNLFDDAYSIYPTNDEGYIVTGQTNSSGAGDFDIWLLKFKYNPSPEIQISKDSLDLIFNAISFSSKDSVVIYNTGNTILNIDTIYSTNASGFVLDIVMKDTTIHTSVSWRSSYYDPFELEPNDSAKLIFTYPLWIPKTLNITETWLDTVIILNNSINNSSLAIPTIIDFPLGINREMNNLPLKFSLLQNFPNPFNPVTKIKYKIPSATLRRAQSDNWVTLKVYDVLGNEIVTLVNEEKQPGTYEVEFNSHSGEGRNLTSGIYFYQLRIGGPEINSGQGFIVTKKMVLLK